jgi:carbamoylphosphate synthase large subunit
MKKSELRQMIKEELLNEGWYTSNNSKFKPHPAITDDQMQVLRTAMASFSKALGKAGIKASVTVNKA